MSMSKSNVVKFEPSATCFFKKKYSLLSIKEDRPKIDKKKRIVPTLVQLHIIMYYLWYSKAVTF